MADKFYNRLWSNMGIKMKLWVSYEDILSGPVNNIHIYMSTVNKR